MMLDLIGAVFGMMAIAINLVAMASVLPLSFRQRLVLAGGAGAWVGLASGLAAAGALTFSPGQPVPLIGLFAAAPLIAAAVCMVPRSRLPGRVDGDPDAAPDPAQQPAPDRGLVPGPRDGRPAQRAHSPISPASAT